jgi:hypothetical protein
VICMIDLIDMCEVSEIIQITSKHRAHELG